MNRQKIWLGAFVFMLSMNAFSMPATTVGGHAACLKKEWLDDMFKFVAAQDRASFQSYVDTQKCVILKEGLHVTVTDSPGMFGGTAGFVYRGIKFWCPREALEYGR